jgi:type 1 glutamine amidotransferase
MKYIKLLILLLTCCSIISCKTSSGNNHPKTILVYSATKGYRHESIPYGIAAIRAIAVDKKWEVIATEDSTYFTKENLKNLSGIVFLNTTGNVLDNKGQEALQQYIHDGGGLAGIHAATDCEYDWPWYNQLIGAYFESHPEQQVATLNITAEHPASTPLPKVWTRKDEWYNFKNVSPSINVIMLLDETSYKGGKMGAVHPASWYHSFEGGKVFYTALGHTKESYSDPLFLKHIEGGISSILK